MSPVGNTLLVQSANVLLKLTLESIVNVVKFGWLSKKSIKSEKTTKTKRRYWYASRILGFERRCLFSPPFVEKYFDRLQFLLL